MNKNDKDYKQEWYSKNKERLLLQMKNYYQKNKEKRKASVRKHRLKIKNRIFNHYGWKCACCGENNKEFLSIDHINGGGRQHIRSLGGGKFWGGDILYRWLIKNNFPEGFRTLCMNCNFAIGKVGYCPHRSKL